MNFALRLRSPAALRLLALVATSAGAFAAGCTGDDPAALCGADCTPEHGTAPQGEAGFEVATGSAVTLVQGGSVQVDLQITRAGFDGPITATASGLPDGVTALPLVIVAGATTGKLTLSALPNSKQGTTPITISASDAGGKIRRDKSASLLVRGPAATLDTTFGNAGKVLASVGVTGIGVRSAAVQADGRILVAGTSDNDFVVVRLGVDGASDTSYGGIGKVSVDLRKGGAASVDVAEAIALTKDGEAVLAGYRSNGGDSSYGIARVTAAGKADPSFDDDGYATPSFAVPDANNLLAFGVAVQTDGSIVLAGTVLEKGAATTEAVIARFKPQGALDDTFGIGASPSSGFFYGHTSGAPNDACEAVTIAPDGRILAACSADDGGAHPVALRLQANGQADPAFGPQNGFSPVPLAGATAHAIHVLADRRVVMTGETADGQLFAVRFDSAGALDTSFAPGGVVKIALGTKIGGARSVVDASGRLVFAAATVDADRALVVARVTSDGKLDTSFGATGFVVTKLGAPAVVGNVRIAQAPDGRIVAVTNLDAAPAQLAAIRVWQ
ncbi:MAG: hypothetical protein JWP87_945 [Labilithrix sp.]|nr:hypothetical protein [Labilithrix sp.]